MKSALRLAAAAACLAGSLFTGGAEANVVITGTRVIYPASQREVSIRLSNEGNEPALVQAWVDSGTPDASPEESTAPFILTPPLSRIAAGKGQTLRLVYLNEPLPTDRESVFYLNMLDIPPNARPNDDRNLLQVAFRTRIKIFFRPDDLPGRPEDAPAQLKWTLVRDASGNDAVACRNDSAYHVSFNEVSVVVDGRSTGLGGGMVSPGGTARFAVKGGASLAGGSLTVRYWAVNDYGAAKEYRQPLAR